VLKPFKGQIMELEKVDNCGIYLVKDINYDRNSLLAEITEKRKTEFCFTVFEHEWANKKTQITNHIKSYNQEDQKIHARKCEVKKINLKELRLFCENYHIQGSNKLGITGWGLYYLNELIGVLSLGRHHRQCADVVLDRMCFKHNIRIIGGASKLFSRAVKWAIENNVERIVSFSDNRWSLGGVYEKIGFKLDKNLTPDYFYTSNNKQYLSKQSQRKTATNCPDDLTEKEWAEKRGLKQVYDAGKKRWVYKIQLKRSIKSYSRRSHGYYSTKKAGIIYYQSSYELRAATLLDDMPDVTTKRFYDDKIINDKITWHCDYCKQEHEQLRITYDRTVSKWGRPICEREGGKISGSKPKKKKENPYAVNGKKQCNECEEIKLFEKFSPDKSKLDGYSTRCKICRAASYKKKYQEKISNTTK